MYVCHWRHGEAYVHRTSILSRARICASLYEHIRRLRRQPQGGSELNGHLDARAPVLRMLGIGFGPRTVVVDRGLGFSLGFRAWGLGFRA